VIALAWGKIFPPLAAVQSVVPDNDEKDSPETALQEAAAPKAVTS
jgi:hypothetical protein